MSSRGHSNKYVLVLNYTVATLPRRERKKGDIQTKREKAEVAKSEKGNCDEY